MEILQRMLDRVETLLPTGLAVVGVVIVLIVVRFILNRRYQSNPDQSFRRQMITMLLSFAGLLVVIMALPISDNTRGQLLSLIGILLSAAIALSATTFVGNIMAGLMLRALRNFRPGNFIQVGEYFGRVSERGLFHVEIQAEDRNLTTLPNLYLVTNPVKVIRHDGTIVSAEVSLGYDIAHDRIEQTLCRAADEAGLSEPFVHVMQLGDFSVTYRVSGLLTESKQLISARARLRAAMLDALHTDSIEIVSPTFMNQRPLKDGTVFIPKQGAHKAAAVEPSLPEEILFDKANEAESKENLKASVEAIDKQIEATKKELDSDLSERRRDELKARLTWLETRRARLADILIEQEKK